MSEEIREAIETPESAVSEAEEALKAAAAVFEEAADNQAD